MLASIFTNNWTITIVGGIIVLIIGYYIFGVGKPKIKEGSINDSPSSRVGKIKGNNNPTYNITTYNYGAPGSSGNTVAQPPSSSKPIASISKLQDQHIKGKVVYLSDMVRDTIPPLISGKTFEDCEIRGPAILTLRGNTSMENCIFDGTLDGSFFPVELNRMMFGVIGAENILFKNCLLVAVGVVGSPEDIERWKAGFNSQPS